MQAEPATALAPALSADDLAIVLREPHRLDALVQRHGADAVGRCVDEERVSACLAFLRPDVAWLDDRRRAAILQAAVAEWAEAQVFEAFGADEIGGVIFKGAALARSHYPAGWCRWRLDLDLLVSRDDFERAAETLTCLGYVRPGRVPGRFINHQDVFERRLPSGLSHTVDLHREISNRVLFASRLPARELIARSRPAAWAGTTLRVLDPSDALLVACAHRVAHHSDRTYLIWSYDVWLIARALTEAEIVEFSRRARALGLASVCAHELADAARLFGGAVAGLAPEVIAELQANGSAEPARRFLEPGRSELGDLALDLRALPRWRDRAQLVAEHLFPPPSFMAKAHGHGGAPRRLSWLYARRLIFGGLRWVRHAATRQP